MTGASTLENVSPGLSKVAERAKREPEGKFHSLAHLIDVPALRRAYEELRANAAVGVDGVSKEQYGQGLEENLRGLHERLKGMRYRHQPIRRVHIPKGQGKTRPIGISCIEDKVVQGAVREVLEVVYEPIFIDGSYGFRPGRSAHQALRALDKAAHRGEANFIIEADIMSFFDSIDRKQLVEMLRLRVPDGSMERLVGKCLHVGVLDGESFTSPDEGTAQGSVLSPLLGNIYLHYVLDVWLEREVAPRLRGKCVLVRYADDFVIGFGHREDAERVMAVLPKRMQRFGLTLHPDKTRLIDFRKPSRDQTGGKGPSSFDFLGFTLYWKRGKTGNWSFTCKTRRGRLARSIKAVYDWCRGHRHLSIEEQHVALKRRVQGHINYFGVQGNARSVGRFVLYVRRAWHKWLNRRSQRNNLTWERFNQILKRYPLPAARIVVASWAT
jgi:group II intron reverse transcriptase/maturase